MPHSTLPESSVNESFSESIAPQASCGSTVVPWTFNTTVAIVALVVGLLVPVLCCDLPLLYVTHPDVYLCHEWGRMPLQRALLWARPVGTLVWAAFAKLPLIPYIAALHAFGIVAISLPFIALRMRTSTAMLAACAVVTHPEFINSNPHDTYTRIAFVFACGSTALFWYALSGSPGTPNRVGALIGASLAFVASGLSKECYMAALPTLLLCIAMRRSLRTALRAAPLIIGCGIFVALCVKLRGGAFVSGLGAYAISPPAVVVNNLAVFFLQCFSPALILVMAAGLAVRIRQRGLGQALLEFTGACCLAMLAMLPNSVLPASHALSMYAAVAVPILAAYAAFAFDSRRGWRYEEVTIASLSVVLAIATLWGGYAYQKTHWWNLFNCKVDASNLHAMEVVRDQRRLPVGGRIVVFGLQQAHHSFLFAPMRSPQAIRGIWRDLRPHVFAGVGEPTLPAPTTELTFFNTIETIRGQDFDLLVVLDSKCDLLATIETPDEIRAFIDTLEDADICQLFRPEDIVRVSTRTTDRD